MTRTRSRTEGMLFKLMKFHEEDLIKEAYARNNNNQVHTANELGINRNTLRSRLEEYGILNAVSIKVVEKESKVKKVKFST